MKVTIINGGPDADVIVNGKLSQEVARRNLRIEVLEERNRALDRKSRRLQRERMERMAADMERANRHTLACIPVVGLVCMMWWAADAVCTGIERGVMGAVDSVRLTAQSVRMIHRHDRAWAEAMGYERH